MTLAARFSVPDCAARDMPFFAREAWRDIPAFVDAMRQFWTPTPRYPPPRTPFWCDSS
jgi:hypothetical protein